MSLAFILLNVTFLMYVDLEGKYEARDKYGNDLSKLTRRLGVANLILLLAAMMK